MNIPEEFNTDSFGLPAKFTRIAGMRETVNEALARRALSEKNFRMELRYIEEAKSNYSNTLKALEVLQHVAAEIQNEAHHKISSLVSKCLAMVFDNPYKFKIEFVKKRGKTEANLLFTRDGHSLDPMDSSGGGVIDVASFALRLACLSLTVPKQRQVIIMDEPFRNVSAGYRSRIRAMLELLTEELGFQFIISTNMKSIETGTIFEIE